MEDYKESAVRMVTVGIKRVYVPDKTLNSAAMNRAKSAGSGGRHATTPIAELRQLKEKVTNLQQDLLMKNMECQRTTDQLNCLISLVKRSWAGDMIAAKHVANIVGAAPPDFQQEPPHNGLQPTVTQAKVKSAAVNHWAVLTVGLLNRHYRSHEQQTQAQQQQYLDMRINWLEEQQLYNRDIGVRHRLNTSSAPARQRRFSRGDDSSPPRYNPAPSPNIPSANLLHRRHSSGTPATDMMIAAATATGQNSRPPSGKKKPVPRPLFRPTKVPESELKWSDFVTDPTKMSSEKTTQNGTSHGARNSPERDNRIDVAYDDPYRYTKHGLYDNEHLAHLRKRPGSSKQQRDKDKQRSRPKSAAVSSGAKQDRPLKFETTRPISAPRHRPLSPKGAAKVNVQGAKLGVRDKEKGMGATTEEADESLNRVIEENRIEEKNLMLEDFNYDDFVPPKEKTKAELELERLMKVDTKKPESVIQYEENMKYLKEMEKTFQRTTLDLQKKLGLPDDGLV